MPSIGASFCRCSGRIGVELTTGGGGALQHAAARVDLQPLQFHLQPEHPALLAHLGACISEALPPQPAAATAGPSQGASPVLLQICRERRAIAYLRTEGRSRVVAADGDQGMFCGSIPSCI